MIDSECLPTVDNGDSVNFTCPHCDSWINILKSEINCAIFRHCCTYDGAALFQVSPHAPKEECAELQKMVAEGRAFGCAGPFRLIYTNEEWFVTKCDYI